MKANAPRPAEADLHQQRLGSTTNPMGRPRPGLAERRLQTSQNQTKKPHSIRNTGNRVSGPAARPQTPLAVENSVGKLTARSGRVRAPNVKPPGKRAWRTPTPNFVSLGYKRRPSDESRRASSRTEVFGADSLEWNLQIRRSRSTPPLTVGCQSHPFRFCALGFLVFHHNLPAVLLFQE